MASNKVEFDAFGYIYIYIFQFARQLSPDSITIYFVCKMLWKDNALNRDKETGIQVTHNK